MNTRLKIEIFAQIHFLDGGGARYLSGRSFMQNAAIVVTIIPVMLVYPFIQRYFLMGLRLGGIKG